MRKLKWILIILLFLILLQVYCTSVGSSTNANSKADNWTQFHQSPSHSGSTTDTSTEGSGKLLWTFTTMDIVSSSPPIFNGDVFVGSFDGGVYCLNASNGQLIWVYSTRSVVESSPAIDNGCVYIGCDDGNVYALNASNGAKLWNYTTGNRVYSSPAVINNVVYVGSEDGNVYAIKATSGAKIWNYSINSSVDSSPAVIDDVVYIASDNFCVYALNATTGNEIWHSHTGSTKSSPCANNGFIYIGSSDGICCLNALTGAQIWKYQTQDSVSSTPAFSNGSIYVGSEDNNIYCLNASTGQKIWQSPTEYWVTSSPAISNGNVYVGSKDYNIYCLNASTGAKQWTYATENFVDSSPAILNETLYIGSDDQHIYAFTLENSTLETTALQSTNSLVWTIIAFDVIAFTIGTAIILAVLSFVCSTKRAKQNSEATNTSQQNLNWFRAHTDAICILVILAFSTIFFINLGSGYLWATDEQTYSQWAFHMVKNADYLTPWAFGSVNFWLGKPPLNMWLMSLAYQTFGFNNFSTRIWSAIFGALSLVFIFYLGKKLYNLQVGLLSAVVLGTFTTFYALARHAMTDVPLVFFIITSIYFFVLSEKTEKTTLYGTLSGLLFGLALMTKQLEALLIPLIIFSYLLATKKSIRFLFTKRFTLFWGLGLLIFSPWLIYMNIRFGSIYWQGFLTFNVISRTLSPVETHAGGFLFYFNYLVKNENLLWIILLPFAAGLCAFNSIIKRIKEDTLILAWITIVLVVFTFAQTKLYWYILPAMPAFAIAISNFLYQLTKKIQRTKH